MSVREFYKGKGVLLTGGTGFMGKVLIEKLLYSAPEVGTVYLLMRPKRGKSVQQRVDEMQKLPLFERLRNECPAAFEKIKPLDGDVLLDNLGLSEKDIELISKDVSIVFHFAATLRLEAPLKASVEMNTCGTIRALNVAKQLKSLALFVHLSTAFCYPDFEVLEEKVHAPPYKPDQIIQGIGWMSDKQLELVTPEILGPHPNCYTFSKRLAESIVQDAYKYLPTVIVRPSIVCPTFEEPIPGWVDNLNGPVGVMLAAGKGVIRTMLCDGSLEAQVIPVDTATNALLTIGMVEGTKERKSDEIPVYNVNIGHHKPTTWGEVLNVARQYASKYPLSWPLWYPNGDITTCKPLHEARRLMYHMVPAYAIDFLLLLLGQKRFLVRIQERITQGLQLLQYFTMRPWVFRCENYDSLQGRLTEADQKTFNMDQSKADRDLYLERCIEGGRLYCLKEDPSKLAINKLYHNFLYVLDWIVKILFWLLIFSFFAANFEPVKKFFAMGGPIVKHLPFLGAAVFNDRDV